ncbi:MAG: hypothetical protein ACPGGE_00955 [Poseidonia sp.]
MTLNTADLLGEIMAFTKRNGFDEVTHYIESLMVQAEVMWKCPECGATYGEEQPCEFCGDEEVDA